MDMKDPSDPQHPGDEPTPEAGGAEPETQAQPAAEQPTAPQPAPEQPTAEQPRRLMRSRTDRVLGGVCGGLGRHLGIDPIIVRIATVVLVLAGGSGVIAYVAALLLVPNEPMGGAGDAPAPPPAAGENRTLLVVGALVLLFFTWPLLLGGGLLVAGIGLPLAFLALIGLLVWALVSGKGFGGGPGEVAKHAALGLGVLFMCLVVFAGGGWAAGVGGGTIAAGLVIAAGAALLVGAFTGGIRWLILPALSLALGVGLVSAAGIDLDGGVGEREYRPNSAADIRDRYQLGVGDLVVDLRGAHLPKGDTNLNLKIGMGQATLLVPRDVCVASTATIGAGAVELFNRENGGVDLDWEDKRSAPAGTSRVVVDADVGLGAFTVRHDPGDRVFGPRGPFSDRGDEFEFGNSNAEPGNTACSTASAGA